MAHQDIPEAEYPQDELLKYSIPNPEETHPVNPISRNPSPDDKISTQQITSETVQVVRIKKKSSRTKHKVQTTPNKTPATLIRRQISSRSWTLRSWYRNIHWKNLTTVVLIPLLGLAICFITNVKLLQKTLYFALLNYSISVLSINIIYHRYLSHHSFEFKYEQTVLLLLTLASGGGVTSASNWCSSHRAHHRYCDVVNRDPHNIKKGFLFAHIGWMIITYNSQVSKVIQESKLDELPSQKVVKWQLDHYFTLFILVGLILPCISCGLLWGDYLGGLVYAGFIKTICVQHCIFSVNSIGHAIGTRPFSDLKSPRNNPLLNLLTLGEGYQNFHHEFPVDYRNSIEWYSIDPTKWVIMMFRSLGLITDLKYAPSSIVEKSLIQQQQKLIDNKRSQLNWGIPIERLPVFSPEQFKQLALASPNRYLVVVSGIIHDVTPFAKDHPGGVPLISASHGKDATTAFNGAVYQHSNAARNLLATMRIGALGGSEQLFWKQQRVENKAVPIDNDSDGNRIVRSGAQATFNKGYGGTADAA